MYFTLDWTKAYRNRRDNVLTIHLRTIDTCGRLRTFEKQFKDWFGILSDDIQADVRLIEKQLPGIHVHYELLSTNTFQSVIPFFNERLLNNNLRFDRKSFYKIYTDACSYDVGKFFKNPRFAYYGEDEWLVRVYLDLCSRFCTKRMFYRWYDIDDACTNLLESLSLVKRKEFPPLKVAVFDLETVPWAVGTERIPTGHDPDDVIVMISLILAHTTPEGSLSMDQKHLLYLNPLENPLPMEDYLAFQTEKELLERFFKLVEPAHVITGYNINHFDTPCLFARCLYLQMDKTMFSSKQLGKEMVPTFQNKLALDYYAFVRCFSPYGLPSFKLDDVARQRLRETKVPIRAVAIHKWYQARDRLTPELLTSNDLAECYNVIDPGFPENEFGTFPTCLHYCMIDSELVVKLMTHEKVLPFLMTRANVSTMNVEQVLYYGNSRYIANVFVSYGTLLGYFIHVQRFTNCTRDGDYEFAPYIEAKNKNNRYQGALNYCEKPGFYTDVSDFDFESLYPSTILCCNISYDTFGVFHSSTVATLDPDFLRNECQVIPYQRHDKTDFETPRPATEIFSFPQDYGPDQLVMVSYKGRKGFIPTLLQHFITKRRKAKSAMKMKGDQYTSNYIKQLSYKLFLNSIYGIFGSTDSCLSNLSLGMSVTCLARMILLGTYHFFKNQGDEAFYCDTDSVFVSRSRIHNQAVNRYLNLEAINLQLNATYPYMLVLTKKRYVYEVQGQVHTKGFEVRSNELTKQMLKRVMDTCFETLKQGLGHPADGWVLLVDILTEAFLASRYPKRYFTTRKVKMLEDYAERCSAPHVRLMKRHQHRDPTDFVHFTYLYADISKHVWQKINPVYVDECEENAIIDFEKLFVSQKKNILMLLNLAFFQQSCYNEFLAEVDEVIQRIRWKSIVNAAVVYRARCGEDVIVLTERGVNYTFKTASRKRRL